MWMNITLRMIGKQMYDYVRNFVFSCLPKDPLGQAPGPFKSKDSTECASSSNVLPPSLVPVDMSGGFLYFIFVVLFV